MEIQQLKLKIQAEQEKTLQLETFINSLSESDANLLQIENSILKTKLESLEKDYSQLKSRLLQDFSSKDLHIENLSETNQLLEEELKSYQEISLSKTKVNSQKMASLEELAKELTRKNQDMAEQMIKQAESFEEEIDHLRHDLEDSRSALEQKKKEYFRALELLEEERSSSEKLRRDINDIEEKLRQVENENEQLQKGINNREKKIKSLSKDLNSISEDIQDTKDIEIEKLQKEISNISKNLKSTKDQLSSANQAKDDLNTKIDSLKQDFQRKQESFEKEKKSAIESKNEYIKKLESIQKEAENKESLLRKAKDDIIEELKNSLLLLKQEKIDLENTLQELQDQIQISRVSFGNEVSLNDELMQLRESYNSRCSTPRNYALESKNKDKLHNDVSEKELQIQILKSENASLKSQFENLVPSLLSKHPEHQSVLAEKKRIETEFVLAKECWISENSNLRNLLEETEAMVINSNLRYAEAATDRDLFYKMYLDYKKNNPKKSWFKKSNK